ncbi:MAG: acyl--CoA ligase [Clostridia bacterium]|nr:acyl--CoA ligase [Clostridia bacterium]
MATKINPADFKIQIDSLYAHFERGKTLYGDKTLYRFNQKTTATTVEVSYKEMLDLITDLALAFQKKEMAGKRVILIGETTVQWIASYISTVTADGVIVPLDPHLLEEEIIKFVKLTKASFVVCSKTYADMFKAHEEELDGVENFIITDRETFALYPEQEYVEERFTTFNNLLALGRYLAKNTDMVLNTRDRDVKKLSILLFTSGTTGSSKGVMLCERNICAVLEGIYPMLAGLTPEDSVMSVLPIYHTYEMSAGVWHLCSMV